MQNLKSTIFSRWRGENVSTTEVEAVVSNMVQLKDAVVYGVEIPGTEGRAGMAAIHDPQEEVDMSELARAIQIELPSFSRPLFVRVVKHLDITGECKSSLKGIRIMYHCILLSIIIALNKPVERIICNF